MRKTLHKSLFLLSFFYALCGWKQEAGATQLSGAYTINAALPATAANFQNFSSAILYLTGNGTRTDGGPSNSAPFGVSGPVVFNVAAGTYNEQVRLDGRLIPGLSSANRVVFDGGGAAPLITQNIESAVVILTQCTYVSLRNLNITNTNLANPAGLYILGNATPANNGTGCSIKHCTVTMFTKTGYLGMGIVVTDSNNITWGQVWADSVEIDSNTIIGSTYGIVMNGGSSSLYNRKIKVRGNTISRVRYGAQFSGIGNGIDFMYNTVSNTGDEGPTSTQEDMIKFSRCNNAGPDPIRIIGNRIDADLSALAIEYSTGVPAFPIQIYNNMITARVGGLRLTQMTAANNYYRVYHNSIYAYSTMTSQYYGGTPFTYISQGQQGGLSCMNNIFAVARTESGDTTIAAAAYIDDTLSRMNYNVYYNPSGGSGRVMVRNNKTYTAANMLTPSAGGDSSVVRSSSWVSNGDLHLVHGCQFTGADLTAEVPYDIDGTPRSVTPHAGCDEYQAALLDLSAEAIVAPVFPTLPGLQDLSFKVRNTGTTPVTSFTASYMLNDSGSVSQPWSGILNPCDTVVVTFTGAQQMNIDSNAVKLKVYVSEPNGGTDLKPSNDTLVSMQLSGTYTIGDTLCDYKTFAQAIGALYSYGMGGNVIFKVKAGTYNEQVIVIGTRIRGLSVSSRLTFEGTDANTTIISGNKKNEALVIMQNCRYITFRGFTISNTNPERAAGIAVIGNILSKRANGTGCAVKQCIINLSAPYATGVHLTSAVGGFSTGAFAGDSIEIDSNTITGGQYGIYISGGTTAATNNGFKIRNNRITNASTCSVYIIWVVNGIDVLNNTFTGTVSSTAGFSLNGFANSGSSIVNITGNRFESQATYGIYFNGCFATNPAAPIKIYNNSVTNAVTGIYHHSGAALNPPVACYELLHNSVSVNRMGTGTAYGFYFFNSLTAGNVISRNNIFAITSPTGVGIPVYYASGIGGPGNSNNNNFYNSTGPVLLYRTRTLTKDNFRTSLGGGDSSVNIKPEWVSATDLHLTAGCKERGGDLSAIVAADINDSLRSSTPNMGCYEYTAYSNDLALDAITAPSFPVVAGLQELKVRLINNGSGIVTSATVSYELNGAASITQIWTGSLAQCDTDIVSFGSLMLGTVNTVKMYTSSPNGAADEYPLNDTIDTKIAASMSGAYTIGDTLCDYKTFAAAISDMLLRGVGGPVVFNVKTGTYNEQVELNSYIPGISEVNTVLFQSAAGKRDSVKLAFKSTSGGNFIFRLNNVSHITLRNLTFEALDSAYAKVIELSGTAAYNTIDSCKVISRSISGGNGSDRTCIYTTGLAGHHNTISNNILTNGQIGIYWWGVSQADPTDSNIIVNNSLSGILMYGLYVQYSTNVKIRNNTINAAAGGYRAVYMTYCTDQMEITGNTVILTGANSYGMFLVQNSGSLFSKALIANNVLICNGAGGYGIYTGSGSYQVYYHNSVLMTGAVSTTGYAGYFQYTVNAYAYNEVKNNIFSNTSGGCAMFFHTLNVSNKSDNNLLYTTGASLIERLAAYPNPTKIANLATWRTLSGQDKHSISYRPPFTSASNLMPNPADSAIWAINGRAIHLDSTLITADKAGTQRPLTPAAGVPDIGAYECTPVSVPPACVAIPQTMPATSPADTVQVFLFGSDTVARITWLASSPIPAAVIIRQYTGEKPPATTGAQNYMYAFTTVGFSVPSAPLFTIGSYYHDEWIGTNPVENDLRVTTKLYDDPWLVDAASTVDPVNNILLKTMITDTAFMLTGTDLNDPLPVKLLNLSATWAKQQVLVNWTTASESNSSYFEVQRSVNGKQFEAIGKVNAAGYSNTLRSYTMADQAASDLHVAVLYYRLRIVDKDGSTVYSNTVSLKRNTESAAAITVFPNPFVSQVYATIQSAGAATVNIELLDITGRTISATQQQLSTGSNIIEVNTDELHAGIYFISIMHNGTREIHKIIKQ